MTADEAKRITVRNAVPLERVIEQIKNAAERGDDMLSCPRLSFEVIAELIAFGYKISEHTNAHTGFKSSVISWR